MKNRSLFAMAASVALLAASVYAADAVKLDGIKCPVSGKDAKADQAVDHNGGKCYLCCPNCKDGLKEHSAAANAQMVATGQFTQKACPLTGKPTKADKSVKVGGVDVALCCPGCQGKLTKATPEDALKMVFADKAFAQGYELKK